ncbi:MAG: glycosyltransferase family A protein [Methylobacterium frigidaeris]
MKLSIVSHFYNNEESVSKAVESYREMSRLHPETFDFVLVDDHSHDAIDANLFSDVENLRVFRIIEDVAWNMPAARNIGVQEAFCDKIVLMDIDHLVDPTQIGNLLSDAERLKVGQIGQFRRRKRVKNSDHEWIEIASHINSFMIHKSDFIRVGGYEENFSGNYGHEDKFFKVCCRRCNMTEIAFDTTLLVQGRATQQLDRDKSVNTTKLENLLRNQTWRAERYLTYKWEMIHPRNHQ